MTNDRSALLSAVCCSLLLSAAACAPAVKATSPQTSGVPTIPPPPVLEVRALELPGAGPEGVLMDYLAYDPTTHRVWVPAGNTGSVDVIAADTDKITRIEGFPTQELERNGKKRLVGPSSATVGDGVVYIGNRGDSTVCAFDARTLAKGGCGKLVTMPDGIAYVASTKEVWVTTPRDTSITILDAGTLAVKTIVKFEGEPEGYAVDDARGLFYTNLEDKDKTLAIEIGTHRIASTWTSNCGEGGPKGLALDHANNFLIVACPDHVEVLDAGHQGALLSKLDTGAGVDNIDLVEGRHSLFVAAGKAARITVATLDEKGQLTIAATARTAPGARNAVATSTGVAYLTNGAQGKILVVAPAR